MHGIPTSTIVDVLWLSSCGCPTSLRLERSCEIHRLACVGGVNFSCSSKTKIRLDERRHPILSHPVSYHTIPYHPGRFYVMRKQYWPDVSVVRAFFVLFVNHRSCRRSSHRKFGLAVVREVTKGWMNEWMNVCMCVWGGGDMWMRAYPYLSLSCLLIFHFYVCHVTREYHFTCECPTYAEIRAKYQALLGPSPTLFKSIK